MSGSIAGRPPLDVFGRVLKQDPLTVALRQHDGSKAAFGIFDHGQRRQRRERQATGARARQLRLQPRGAGGQEQVLGAGAMAGGPAELVRDVRRVGCDMVKPRDQAECGKVGPA